MCGRFVSSSTPEQIGAYFGADAPETVLEQNFNVAPTNDIYAVVIGADGSRRVEVFRWGLVPSWAKDAKIGSKMINARSETLAEKGAFKPLLRSKRCIIPMDGFYEWQTRTGADIALSSTGKPVKQPMFIHRLDGELLAVAGLWSPWRDKTMGADAPWLHSATVITTSANETMSAVHDRMPVILPASLWETWLDPLNTDIENLSSLLVPAANGLLTVHPVSTAVNKVSNNGVELLAAVRVPISTATSTSPASRPSDRGQTLFD